MYFYKKPQDLYSQMLLENVYFGNRGEYCTRVPGGWIFHTYAGEPGKGFISTFVPYNEEFRESEIDDIIQGHNAQDDTPQKADKAAEGGSPPETA